MRYLLVSLCLLFAASGRSQPVKPDTSFLASARTIQFGVYDSLIGGNSRLYNGTQYKDYFSHNDEHPYFGIDDWSRGSIIYDDEFYEGVDMFYDISKDVVITEHSLTGGKIEMISNKVSRFTIGDHLFIRLWQDQKKTINDGFYEVLYDGRVKVYARRQKAAQSRSELSSIIYYFATLNRVYLLKDNAYTLVKSKRAVFDVFDDHRKELAAFLRKSGTSFRRNREQAIIGLAKEYDRIDR